MNIEFKAGALKNPVQQIIQLDNENLEYFRESLNGTLEDGVLRFQISNHPHYAIAGDWLVLFDGGRDILVFTNKMFQRLFKSVDV